MQQQSADLWSTPTRLIKDPSSPKLHTYSCSPQANPSSPETHRTCLPFSPQKSPQRLALLSSNRPDPTALDLDRQPTADRYIPSRKLVKKESLLSEEDYDLEVENKRNTNTEETTAISDLFLRIVMTDSPKKRRQNPIDSFENNNILKFSEKPQDNNTPLRFKDNGLGWTQSVEAQSPKTRKVNKLPIKVLDAPALQDDYYLNLLDWGAQNQLAVGLATSVYLWNASNSKVSKLCDLGQYSTTAVGWAPKDPFLAIGSDSGEVQIWDIQKMKKVRSLSGHTNRVGVLSWGNALLSSGSRDKTILHRDLRSHNPFLARLEAHRQEVCGLKWSPDDQLLCSGGNDNRLLVWSPRANEPVLKFTDHQAAVKAVAWSPHQHGLLASGGGTADRTIRFRNTLTGATTKVVEAGSQVCSLMFSRVSQELVSTHGYQNNQINLWKMPNMTKTASLTGHSSRVLYLAMSADGSTIVTGAGDETLRFWQLFPQKNSEKAKFSLSLSETACLR